ncbi:hypothetical protein [Bacillus sp. m3-13]|uniref:hypothetical protein n=1 Tax=Bacillaceae TaxID=186817 RepID=UPI0002F48541|nr:hypothetical protein [Bacillus sp. m3-13]
MAYAPLYVNEEDVEDVTIVGEGLSKEELIKVNPNSLIIGEDFDKNGSWVFNSENKADYDVAEAIYEGMIWHYKDMQ